MELGQRIKTARQEAGLSQRQLCGDRITRNMLSLIENGTARPSMDTLAYLAQQLGKPVSFFLEETAVTSPNQPLMEQARKAFRDGDHQHLRDILTQYRQPDETFDWEYALLLALACLALAEQALSDNRIPYARHLLAEATQAGEKTPYYTKQLQARHQLLLARADTPAQLPDIDSVLLLKAEAALGQEQPEKAGVFLDACEARNPYWHLLRGKALWRQSSYRQAAQQLHLAEEAYPRETTALLEQCYSALEDYKMAYFYACKQKE